MRYTTGGQDAHPTRVLLLKFVPHSNGICCKSRATEMILSTISVVVGEKVRKKDLSCDHHNSIGLKSGELMTENDNIEFVGFINETIAIEAAQIRARYNLQLPDALQIAVALNAECEAFLTNDLTFKRITELRVLVLNDFNNA
ncbi:MAG: type II toxin-antitoxin system VapC family toxin, partial [Dolichospermum sp.]